MLVPPMCGARGILALDVAIRADDEVPGRVPDLALDLADEAADVDARVLLLHQRVADEDLD
eukprot:5388027-Pyramimonas_sp.AAC.1